MTPASFTAAPDWPRRSTGPLATRSDLNELERDFLDDSRADAEHEAEHQRRANRRLRALLAGVAGLLALALVAGVVALNQRGEARDAALAADAQRLSAESLTRSSASTRRCCFTRAAVELDESPATRGNLLSVLLRAPAAIGVVNHGWPMLRRGPQPGRDA